MTEGGDTPVRLAAVSGMFYPSNARTLSIEVGKMLADVEPTTVPGRLIALVVPHAGIMYCGPVAAHAYRQLSPGMFPRVVLVGSSHRYRIGTASIYPNGSWSVPNGEFPVDAEFVHKLQSRLSAEIEGPAPHIEEHCLEVQLPFLAETLGQVPIVPILMGTTWHGFCEQVGTALAETIREGYPAILLASTDLSHYKDQKSAEQLDYTAIDAILTMSTDSFCAQVSSGACELCGVAAVTTVMSAAGKLGANRATLLRYATSGDITGDFSQVVGYTAIALSIEN